MCAQGVKFIHQPNELVLCFEPDPTKAKVLYYAKVRQLSSLFVAQGVREFDGMLSRLFVCLNRHMVLLRY